MLERNKHDREYASEKSAERGVQRNKQRVQAVTEERERESGRSMNERALSGYVVSVSSVCEHAELAVVVVVIVARAAACAVSFVMLAVVEVCGLECRGIE